MELILGGIAITLVICFVAGWIGMSNMAKAIEHRDDYQ